MIEDLADLSNFIDLHWRCRVLIYDFITI